MIFEVNRKTFLRALAPVVEVAGTNVIKDFKYEKLVTLEATQDELVLTAFGGAVSILAPISGSNFAPLDYVCSEEGSITIYGEDLVTFLQSLSAYNNVKISIESNQLKVESTTSSAKSAVRRMPTVDEVVSLPNNGKVFEQDVTINREVFVKGIESVQFAPAFEEKMYSYMCMLFEAIGTTDQELRFSAGSGGRFAVKSVKGKNIITNNQEANMIFPKDSLRVILKLLQNATSPVVSIRTVDADQQGNIPDQIMIEFDGISVCIFGLEYFTNYPDLTKIINYKYSNRVYTNLDDWRDVSKTIEGTKHRWAENIHNTEIVFEEVEDSSNDADKGTIIKITPKTPSANPSFIDIVDVENCSMKGEKIWFRCNSDYIREMVSQGGKGGKIQFNFESQSILDEIPDDKPKQMKPVLVKFSEDIDKPNDLVNNFYMFFTVSNK